VAGTGEPEVEINEAEVKETTSNEINGRQEQFDLSIPDQPHAEEESSAVPVEEPVSEAIEGLEETEKLDGVKQEQNEQPVSLDETQPETTSSQRQSPKPEASMGFESSGSTENLDNVQPDRTEETKPVETAPESAQETLLSSSIRTEPSLPSTPPQNDQTAPIAPVIAQKEVPSNPEPTTDSAQPSTGIESTPARALSAVEGPAVPSKEKAVETVDSSESPPVGRPRSESISQEPRFIGKHASHCSVSPSLR